MSPDKLKPESPLPTFVPSAPAIRSEAFDREDYIFELNMDGFRALAYIDEHETRLVSRKGNVYKSFVQLRCAIHIDLDCQAVLDGEIVILDNEGRPQFYELLRRRGRGEPVFYAFDVLWLDREDLQRATIDRQEKATAAHRSEATISDPLRRTISTAMASSSFISRANAISRASSRS